MIDDFIKCEIILVQSGKQVSNDRRNNDGIPVLQDPLDSFHDLPLLKSLNIGLCLRDRSKIGILSPASQRFEARCLNPVEEMDLIRVL
jgi:hypothetical protein